MTESQVNTPIGDTPILEAPKKNPHLMDFFTLLAKYRKAVMFIPLTTGILFFAFTYFMPQTFTGLTTIIPPEKSQQSGLLNFLTGSGVLDIMKGAENPALDMFKNVLDSRQLSEQIAEDPRIFRYFSTFDTSKKLVAELIRSSMESEPLRNSLFNVSISIKTHWNPTQAEKDSAKNLVAYLSQTFIRYLDRYNRERMMTQARTTRIFVESEYNARMRQLDSQYAKLQAFQQEHKTISLTEQLTASVVSAAQVAAQVQQLDMQIGVAERELTPSSGRVQMLKAQLEEAKREMKKYEDGGVGDYVMAFKDVPELAHNLANLTREVKILETISAFLRQQLEQERISEQRDLPTLHVLDAAVNPERRSSPSRLAMLLLGLFSGFVIAILYVATRNYFVNVRLHPEEHTRYLNFVQTLQGKKSVVHNSSVG
ncbi:MAG: GNVR domain-containing protein [bacterium]